MNLKVGDILKTEAAWEQFRLAFTQAFYFKIQPEIKNEIYKIAQEEIYTYQASPLALARRRPKTSRLGSYSNIKVDGKFISKTEFEIYFNDITQPQKPIVSGYTWDDDIFLIDLVSGTLKDDFFEAVIPNIFTYPKKYPWSRPNYRKYKQKMIAYMNSNETKELFKNKISTYPAVVEVIEKYFEIYVKELIQLYKQKHNKK